VRTDPTSVSLAARLSGLDVIALGDRMYELCESLFPICRSITGDGVRRTLDILGDVVPMERHEVPSGTAVFDWTIPPEWNIRDAYVADDRGERVIDFRRSNLHVVGYSAPVRRRMSLHELRPHLHTLPDRPHAVPYRTAYYDDSWGFCLAHDALEALPDGEYEVVIDASLADGSLSYGETVIAGRSAEEVLLTAHVCHPSLANDNLSGLALLAVLGQELARVDLRYTYRLLFIPGTIGSITWLARNEAHVGAVRHGIVVSGVGDVGAASYKRSRRGDAEIDRAACHVLGTSGDDHRILDFHPYGYDERQFCSPGFNLPVGRFGRSPHSEYPEYHTSADDLAFVGDEALVEAYDAALAVLDVLEHDRPYRNLSPCGEPQLGRRGLYPTTGGQAASDTVMAMLWTLAYSDGDTPLLEIAELADLDFARLDAAAADLVGGGLLAPQ
jgi:aminopeptidase-like protein